MNGGGAQTVYYTITQFQGEGSYLVNLLRCSRKVCAKLYISLYRCPELDKDNLIVVIIWFIL